VGMHDPKRDGGFLGILKGQTFPVNNACYPSQERPRAL